MTKCNRCREAMIAGEDMVEIVNPQGTAEVVHMECVEDGDEVA
jgi:hypothetical protein